MLRGCLFLFFMLPLKSESQDLLFREVQGQVQLWDANRLVYAYQMNTQSINGDFPRANYLHPVNDLDGNSLTEDFPEDHLHHRGIFWAWHQLYINGESVADPWECRDIIWQVASLENMVVQNRAELTATVHWLAGESQTRVMKENVSITYRAQEDHYMLDFDLRFTSEQDHLELGGSRDEKGYGGFSARFELGDQVIFYDNSGKVAPQNTQVQAGNWIKVTGIGKDQSEVVIMYHPKSSASLQGWILRDQGSMQNPVWPGRDRVTLNQGDTFDIKARLVVFKGKAGNQKVQEIFKKYAK